MEKAMFYLAVYLSIFNIVVRVYGDVFNEELLIKPLSSSHLYTYFQFITNVNTDSFEHSHMFPRPFGEMISEFQIEELHISLTQGQWRHNEWGYPVIDAAPGAELYAWFSNGTSNIDGQWKKLSSSLSGLLCASLNFIDRSNTIKPNIALWPTGAFDLKQNISENLRYAALPREIVCTENLTPWKKLLPCESKKGLAALLNAGLIHQTNYHSIGIHYRKVCKTKECSQIESELKLTVALVYDYKIMNSMDWSFRKLFGQGLPGACPLSSFSNVFVDISSNETQPFQLTPEPDEVLFSTRGGSDTKYAIYNLKNRNQMINIGAKYTQMKNIVLSAPPPLTFNRYIVGYGKEFGGVVTELTNNCWTPIYVVLLENAPWWLPIQLNSLRINGQSNSDLLQSWYFTPGHNRQKPYHLELLLKLPKRSTTTVSINFEFVFLKWQEYPPDANHGFYIGSALITANLPTAKSYLGIPVTGSSLYSMINSSQPWYPAVFRTNGGMVSLPTPDFSMPYNVICLACTVVALAFGPLHNICTKQLSMKPIGTPVSLFQKILRLLKRNKQ